MKRKKLLSGALALGMAISSVLGATPLDAHAQNPVQSTQESSQYSNEWEFLSEKLDNYVGVYTENTKIAVGETSDYTPDGPLMGNGTVYAFMGGNQKEQKIYISHNNMWQDRKYATNKKDGVSYTTFGGITIKEKRIASVDNLALG